MVNKIQNGNGLSERTNIKKLKLGTKLSKQINNTSLTFEKKKNRLQRPTKHYSV